MGDNRRRHPSTCERCGVDYMAFNRGQRFCSRSCASRTLPGDTLEERLILNSYADGECVRWEGAMGAGYGHMYDGGKLQLVHRLAYELWIGPIPPGHDLDHVHARGCRHTDCFNPAHLEPVSHRENLRRAAARITHCPHGHPYAGDNLVIEKSGKRKCRTCRRAIDRRISARRKAAREAAS